MKKIAQIDTNQLYAKDHFLFMTEVKGLISSFGSIFLNIDTLFNKFLVNYEQHHENIKKMGFSADAINILEKSDKKRDDYYYSIAFIVKAYTKHIDEKIRAGATKIEEIINKYGNLKYIPYEEETIQLSKLCYELTQYPNELNSMHLNEWITMLNDENEAFKNFYYVINQQLVFLDKIKNFRSNVDDSYTKITSKIEALSVIENMQTYSDFINKLNVIIEKYITTYNDSVAKTNEVKTPPPVIPESFY